MFCGLRIERARRLRTCNGIEADRLVRDDAIDAICKLEDTGPMQEGRPWHRSRLDQFAARRGRGRHRVQADLAEMQRERACAETTRQ